MSTVISFEELSKKHPIHNVPPYGACIVVPGDKFDPDWEAILEDCSCHHTDFEGKPVTLVHQREAGKDKGERVVFSPEKPEDSQAVSEPKPARSIEKHLVVWTKEDLERFIKLWNEDPDYEKILKSFPNRTKIALKQKATELKKAGIIENAYVVKAKLKKGEPLKPPPEINIQPVGSPIFRRDGYLWSKEEEKLVIELWNAKKTAAQIQKELAKANPNRSEARSLTAISAEIARLQARGSIKRRFEWKKKKETKQEVTMQSSKRASVTTEAPIEFEHAEQLVGTSSLEGQICRLKIPEKACKLIGVKGGDFVILRVQNKCLKIIPADIRPREIMKPKDGEKRK